MLLLHPSTCTRETAVHPCPTNLASTPVQLQFLSLYHYINLSTQAMTQDFTGSNMDLVSQLTGTYSLIVHLEV